ncbi:MAG: type II toxin-antitoxin system Phd/YefM family antitoxin [Magnetovibrionaceae bacterium]
MKLTDQVKPISYLKAHAPEVLKDLEETRNPVVITVNGEAKAVLQDLYDYEQTQETLALLKMLAQSRQAIENGDVQPAEEAFRELERLMETEDVDA